MKNPLKQPYCGARISLQHLVHKIIGNIENIQCTNEWMCVCVYEIDVKHQTNRMAAQYTVRKKRHRINYCKNNIRTPNSTCNARRAMRNKNHKKSPIYLKDGMYYVS